MGGKETGSLCANAFNTPEKYSGIQLCQNPSLRKIGAGDYYPCALHRAGSQYVSSVVGNFVLSMHISSKRAGSEFRERLSIAISISVAVLSERIPNCCKKRPCRPRGSSKPVQTTPT